MVPRGYNPASKQDADEGSQPNDHDERRPPRLGRRDRQAHPARPYPLVHRLGHGTRRADPADAGQRRPPRTRPGDLPQLLPAPLAPLRRGAGRAPDVHLHEEPRRRGPEQPLDGSRGGPPQDRRPVRGLHEGPHDVRRALLHGPDPLALRALRGRDHRQPLRRAQHAHHDAHGRAGARPHRARRQLREGPALDRRPEPRPPLHHAFPGGALDQEHRFGLRRQCAARQEMPCAAHRQLAGTHRGLARRAHADRGHREPARRGALHRRGVSVGLRQDQPRHAHSARHHAGLEGVDHRRGHRVAARGQRWPAARNQPRGGLLRRGPGHQPQDQPQRLRDDPPRHDLHERGRDRRQPAVVGRPHERRAGHRLAGPPLRQGERTGRASEFALHGLREAEPGLQPPDGAPRGRADLGDPVRRPPPRSRAARRSRPATGRTA